MATDDAECDQQSTNPDDANPQLVLVVGALAERFAALHAGLIEAQQQFDSVDDHGQLAAITSLRHVTEFLDAFDELRPLGGPLANVALKLLDVKAGHKPTIFQPPRTPGNRRLSQKEKATSRRALVAVQAAVECGWDLEKEEHDGADSRKDGAYRLVSQAFGVSVRQLRSWRQKAGLAGRNWRDTTDLNGQTVISGIENVKQKGQWPATKAAAANFVKRLAQANQLTDI